MKKLFIFIILLSLVGAGVFAYYFFKDIPTHVIVTKGPVHHHDDVKPVQHHYIKPHVVKPVHHTIPIKNKKPKVSLQPHHHHHHHKKKYDPHHKFPFHHKYAVM